MATESRQERRRSAAQAPSPGATPANTDRVVRSADQILHQELRLDTSAFGSLSLQAQKELLELAAAGPKTAGLAVRILNAVHRTSPGRQSEAVQKLRRYPGSLVVLEDFLNRIGIDDPFIATERAQVLILPVSALPRGSVISGESEDREGPRRRRESVRGASGHQIKGMIYCAYDKNSPSASVGFFSKRQAVTRPFETFNPKAFGDKRDETRRQRTRRYRDVIKELDLFDLETNPEEAARTRRSPIIARDLAIYAELRSAIADFKEKYQDLLYSGEIAAHQVQALNLRTDPGGTFMGWFDRQVVAGMILPDGIRAAYESLRDPDVQLEPEVERDYVRGLIAYQKTHSFIEKDAALTGALADLETFDGLPDADPLKVNHALERARRTLQELERIPGGELRLTEFSAVVSLGGLAQFRRAMNERVLKGFEQEYHAALDYFREFFIEDGRWQEDSLGDSVPMGRLGETLYGARIGAKNLRPRDDERRALLTHNDFKNVRDALFQQSVSGADQTRLLLSMPISHFREMFEGLICAFRKAKYLDRRLDEYQSRRTAQGEPQLLVNRRHVGETLADWKPVLPLGNDLRPQETFMGNEKDGLPLEELMARVKALGLDRRAFGPDWLVAEAHAQAGLYAAKYIEGLKALQARAALYSPSAEYTKELVAIREMLDSPLASPTSWNLRHIITKSYVSRPEALELTNAARFKAEFDRLALGLSERTRSLGEKLKGLRLARIVTGSVEQTASGACLRVSSSGFDSFAEEKKLHGFSYFEPDALALKLADLENQFARADRIAEDWFLRIKQICRQRPNREASESAQPAIDNNTYYAVQSLHRGRSVFVSKTLLSAVNSLSTAHAPVRGGRVGPSSHFRWEQKGEELVAVFGFGKHATRPIAEVVQDLLKKTGRNPLWYFTDFIGKRDFPPHVLRIAEKVVEIARRRGGSFDAQAFHRWLAEKQQTGEW